MGAQESYRPRCFSSTLHPGVAQPFRSAPGYDPTGSRWALAGAEAGGYRKEALVALSRIRQVSTFSVARNVASVALVVSLVVSALLALATLCWMAAATAAGGVAVSLGGRIAAAVIGVAAVAVTPVLGGITGFLAGLLGAALYNLTAGMTGGIEVDLS